MILWASIVSLGGALFLSQVMVEPTAGGLKYFFRERAGYKAKYCHFPKVRQLI